MPMITTRDGTGIFYKDWGAGPPVVFSHGWPLNADAWDEQLNLVASHGFRAIAHDRRGHGRSGQPWRGHDMDTYADDLSALLDSLDLREAVLVGHSTGGGEIARYIGRHGGARVAKAVLLGAVPPLMLRTPNNPEGTPMEVFDDIRKSVRGDRSQFLWDFSASFYGADRAGSTITHGARSAFWLMGMQVAINAALECVAAFSETDFTDDLRRFEMPTLVAHGDDDQIVPIQAAANKSAQLIPHATLQVYSGAPHGLAGSYRDAFERDLLSFLTSRVAETATTG